MAIVLWLVVLLVVVLIFIWMWRLADRIERAEREELSLREYIASLRQADPNQAMYWQQVYDMKYRS